MDKNYLKIFRGTSKQAEIPKVKEYAVTEGLYRSLTCGNGDTSYPLWIYQCLNTASTILNSVVIKPEDLLSKSMVVQLVWYAADSTLALCEVLHNYKKVPECKDYIERLVKFWESLSGEFRLKSSELPNTVSLIREPFDYGMLQSIVGHIKFLAHHCVDLEIPSIDDIHFPDNAW